jgi:hypothetical protein
MPLPRDPVNGVSAASIKRQGIFRRKRSMARVNLDGPAPTINTAFPFMTSPATPIVFVRRTNVKERAQLSREAIGAAALAIADAEGFQAVSMRRVAQQLNTGTMSLYYYFKTKDDLVGVMDDEPMSEALLPSVPRNWKRAITEIARRTHSVFSPSSVGDHLDAIGSSWDQCDAPYGAVF